MNHLTSTCIADDYIVCVHAGNQSPPFVFRVSLSSRCCCINLRQVTSHKRVNSIFTSYSTLSDKE
jgi:hypothetical protein